jgi:hypothetical protein
MASRYFFDLPVYRLSSDEYYAARSTYIDNAIFRPGTPDEPYFRQREKVNPGCHDTFRDHLERSYGGCWDFIEIIGYIRLHFLGNQVRGEYFAVARKRIVRTRTKTLEFQTWTLAPEVDIEHPCGSVEVLAAVQQYIRDCGRKLPKRLIDTTQFDKLAPHINWGSLYRND